MPSIGGVVYIMFLCHSYMLLCDVAFAISGCAWMILSVVPSWNVDELFRF